MTRGGGVRPDGSVTPTETSGFRVHDSVGVPLAAPLRTELERQLRADLGPVRIHTDQPAATAVTGEAAAALTAGTRIYFGPRRFDPGSDAGRDLLVHELTHVLQQTGRSSTDGRLATGHRAGSGPARARHIAVPPTPGQVTVADGKDIDWLVEVHKASNPGNRELQREFAHLATFPAGDGGTAYWYDVKPKIDDAVSMRESSRKAASAAGASVLDPKDVVRGVPSNAVLQFWMDVAKVRGERTTARSLLDQQPDLNTAMHDERIVAEDDSFQKWEVETYLTHPLFKRLEALQGIAALVVEALLEPAVITDLSRRPRIIPSIEEARARANPVGRLGANERVHAVLLAVDRVEDLVRAELARLANRAAAAGLLGTDALRQVAVGMKKWAESRTSAPEGVDEPDEVLFLVFALASVIAVNARAAVEAWDRVADLAPSLEVLDPAEASGIQREILTILGTSPQVKQFATMIEAPLKGFFALAQSGVGLDGRPRLDGLPDPTTYTGRRKEITATVRQAAKESIYPWVHETLHPHRKRPIAGSEAMGDTVPRGSQIQAALIAVWEVDRLIRGIVVGESGDLEHVIAHRLWVARRLAPAARVLGATSLETMARDVLHARSLDQTHLQIALLSDWTETASSPADLTEDFGSRPLEHLANMTPFQVRLLFETVMAEELAQQVDLILDAENDRVYNPRSAPVIARARAAMEASRVLPKRFTLSSADHTVLEVPEGLDEPAALARTKAKEAEFLSALVAQPKTQKLIDQQVAATSSRSIPYIVSSELAVARGLEPPYVIWTLPMEAAFDLLLSLTLGRASERDAVPSWVDAASGQTWYERLGSIPVTVWLEQMLDQRHATRMAALERSQRAASCFDRIGQTTELRRLLLARPHSAVSKVPNTNMIGWQVPDHVASRLRQIAGMSLPAADRPYQLAIAVAELAVEGDKQPLERLLLNIEDDRALALAGLINEALRCWTNPKAPEIVRLLAPTERGPDWPARRVKAMVEAEAALRGHIKPHPIGLKGVRSNTKGERSHLSAIGHARQLGLNEDFTIDGITWRIMSVDHDFEYTPHRGRIASVLTVSDTTGSVSPSTSLLHVVIGGRHPVTPITPRDEGLLDALSSAVLMESLVRDMDDLGAAADAFGQVLVTGAEFIPGFGQELLATEIVTSVLTFLSDPQMKELLGAMLADPKLLLDELKERVRGLLLPERLWEAVLFGQAPFARLKTEGRKPKVAPTRAKTGWGPAIVGLIKGLYQMGDCLYQAFARAQTHVRWGVESLEVVVAEHPALVDLLGFIDHNAENALGAIDALENVEDMAEAFVKDFGAMLASLRNLELPHQLVDTAALIDLLITFVIARVPNPKVKWGGKAIIAVLRATGAWATINDAVTDAITNADPNKLWVDFITKTEPGSLREMLTKARDNAFTALDEELALLTASLKGKPGFDKVAPLVDSLSEKSKQGPKESGAVVPTTADVDVATIEGADDVSAVLPTAPSPGPAVAPAGPVEHTLAGHPVPLPTSAGHPLPPALRHPAERDFGVDFGHVRLHTDGASTAAAAGIGAEALTTGSHVYLGPGLDPSSGRGAEVLNHELTHVVQQTGPVAPGERAPAPSLGAPGEGLRIDPRAEAEARSAETGATGATLRGSTGVQPASSSKAIHQLLGRVTSMEDIRGDAAREAAHGGTKGAPPKLVSEARKLVKVLNARFSAGDEVEFVAPFKEAKDAISKHLTSAAVAKDLDNALGELVRDALRQSKATADGKTVVTAYIDQKRFARELTRTLYGVSGVVVEIEMDGDAKVGQPLVLIGKPKVRYLDMSMVPDGSDLWKKLLPNSASAPSPGLRLSLAMAGVSSNVWDGKAFHLKKHIIDRASDVTARLDGASKIWPKKEEYLTTDEKTAKSSGRFGHLGLRLGTYKEHIRPGPQWGRDRESHHLTQYLLVQYFGSMSNDGAKAAFPLPEKAAYPGLKTGSSGITGFRRGTDAVPVNLSTTGEAGWMPTILLSRSTHQGGHLHVRSLGPDEKPGTPGPSGAVAAVFRSGLRDDYKAAEKKGPAAFDTWLKNTAKSEGPAFVEQHILVNMLRTFVWMRDYMRAQLGPALRRIELPYFNAFTPIERDHITPSDMSEVFNRSKRHHDEVMKNNGWTEPGA